MRWCYFLVGIIPLLLWGNDAGLVDGSRFVAHYLSGWPTILCPSSHQGEVKIERQSIYCDYIHLTPVEQSRFYTTSGVRADMLVISSLSSNGESSTLLTEFDASTGQSKQELNLWSWLLLRRPLLRLGENNRHYLVYDLYLGQELVEQGDFFVTVSLGPPRYCPARVIAINDPTDCKFTKYVCLRYFREVSYCR